MSFARHLLQFILLVLLALIEAAFGGLEGLFGWLRRLTTEAGRWLESHE